MYTEDLKHAAKQNMNFRKVLHTGAHSQIVAMSIPVGDDIGMETHDGVDQILVIVDGDAEAIVNDEVRKIEEHDVVFIPSGAKHNVINIGDEDLKLFTVYSPPEHPDGIIHATKQEALKAEKYE